MSDITRRERVIPIQDAFTKGVDIVMNAKPGAGQALTPRAGIDIVVSPSQLSAWNTCRHKWWMRYVAMAPTAPKLTLRWGNAMHKVFEEYNLGATIDELFSGPGGGRAVEIGLEYLYNVEGIDLQMELERLAKLCKVYLMNNPTRLDEPEEDRSAYLFTLDVPGLELEQCPRVFLRGITDGKLIKRTKGEEPEITLVDYKSSARRWPYTRSDREAQPSYYALRERLTTGGDEFTLVHEVVLKDPPKCKSCKGKGCDHLEKTGLEQCQDGHVYQQRWKTTRGLEHMAVAVRDIIAFAVSRVTLGNSVALHGPQPAYDQMNCGMCDYKDCCYLHGGQTPNSLVTPPLWAPERRVGL